MTEEKTFTLSPDQALKIMAIGVLLRDGDICIRGDDEDDVKNATEALIDCSQEIAIQHIGY